jgi:hypothetical protein
MFVIVAIKAQEFPIAAIGWIIIMIVIAMVNSELLKISGCKFSRAASANPRVHFERLSTIGLFTFSLIFSRVGDDLIEFIFV